MAVPDKVLENVMMEINSKVEHLNLGIKSGSVPTRGELEKICWKTGRLVRQLAQPEKSKEREIFWSECKGILKRVLVIESFNAGVFTSASVKPDVIESDVLSCFETLVKYVAKRRKGLIAAPEEVLPPPSKVAKTDKEDDDWASWGDKSKGWKGDGKGASKNLKEWNADAWYGEGAPKKWDEQDSDPEEPCPDIVKFGNCSYGRQCGFCNR
eukprot:TRINITY_DN56240_c0_g1_i1.p1 TRINITY_DN56240_c0_g1~~TRINITY_DN56240_c0_g1_i1.p1  ORF type:complete len:233 (-),score=40.33 TRINITY_DN56240_c0_g1_i1:109-741(-)